MYTHRVIVTEEQRPGQGVGEAFLVWLDQENVAGRLVTRAPSPKPAW